VSEALQTPEAAPEHQALADALRLSFRLLRGALLALLPLWLLSGVFVVRQHERAVVLRFGRPTGLGAPRVFEPGLHWTWPRPICEIARLETERIRIVTAGPPPPPPSDPERSEPGLEPSWEHFLLTGDANLMLADWALRYTVQDPAGYLFRQAAPEALLSNELARAVARVAAGTPVEAALRTGVEALREGVEVELRRRLADAAAPVRVERVDVLWLAPPARVADAFGAVVQAEQERSRLISEAQAYATRRLNEAGGDADRLRSEAAAAWGRIVSEVRSEADYFESVFAQYREQPEVLRQTLWQDALRRALKRLGARYFIRPLPDGRQELRLWLSPSRGGPRPAPPAGDS